MKDKVRHRDKGRFCLRVCTCQKDSRPPRQGPGAGPVRLQDPYFPKPAPAGVCSSVKGADDVTLPAEDESPTESTSPHGHRPRGKDSEWPAGNRHPGSSASGWVAEDRSSCGFPDGAAPRLDLGHHPPVAHPGVTSSEAWKSSIFPLPRLLRRRVEGTAQARLGPAHSSAPAPGTLTTTNSHPRSKDQAPPTRGTPPIARPAYQ